MKKELLISIMALFIVFNANSQTVLLEEDFSSGGLPSGWENIDLINPTKLWEFDNPGDRAFFSTTNANGFAIFDSENYPANGTDEAADLITSNIDCSASTVVRIRFEHYLDANYGGSGKLFISGNNGSSWTQVDAWVSNTTNPAIVEYDISTIAAGNSEVKIKWHWEGVWSMYWCVDDIKVFEPGADDLGVSGIVLPAGVEMTETMPVSAIIKNYGSSEVLSSYDVQIVIEDESNTVVFDETKTFAEALSVDENFEAIMDGSFNPETAGIHTVTATVSLVGDINISNNTNSNTTVVYDMGGTQIFTTGGIVTHPGAGVGGYDVSAPQNVSLGINTIGKKISIMYEKSVADDFIIPEGETWMINSFKFYAYQTGAVTSPSSINDVRIKIYDGAPNAGGTVIHDLSTSNMLTLSFWSEIYRVSMETDLAATNRPIMELICNISEIELTEGEYWIEYQAAGTMSSGPWTPLVSILGVENTGNALEYDNSWAEILDGDNSQGQGVPFKLYGHIGGANSYITTFHITDINGGANLEGAHLTITDGTTTYEGDTNIDGDYVVDLNIGDYTYTATLLGYDDYIITTPYTVSEVSTVEIEMTQSVNTYSTTFHITDINGGASLEGAHLTITDGTTTYEGDTDINGNYIIDLNAGDYTYTVTLTGYEDYIITTPYTVSEVSTVEIEMVQSVSIEYIESNLFDIYPNPSNGIFNIISEQDFMIEIINISGKVIKEKKLKKGNNTVEITTSGIYFIKISNNNSTYIKKLIVK
ncbi:MAG: T9SS type A sorting domain-containing protein [Bacteroidales bacterium]|nr:T9SS type A sorting domain-containing protein [Bacteroidales bacterium]